MCEGITIENTIVGRLMVKWGSVQNIISSTNIQWKNDK